jgi:hypothetical protein
MDTSELMAGTTAALNEMPVLKHMTSTKQMALF